MIRIPDLGAPQWMSASLSPVRPADAKDQSSWFDAEAVGASMNITGDLNLAARGLGVEQHASRVLAQLCGEPDASP